MKQGKTTQLEPRKPGEILARLESLTFEGLQVLEDILATGDPREKTEAARALLQAYAKIATAKPAPQPKEEVEKPAPAQIEQSFDRMLAEPSVRDMLERRGFKVPK